jgi:hypothetical protein
LVIVRGQCPPARRRGLLDQPEESVIRLIPDGTLTRPAVPQMLLDSFLVHETHNTQGESSELFLARVK